MQCNLFIKDSSNISFCRHWKSLSITFNCPQHVIKVRLNSADWLFSMILLYGIPGKDFRQLLKHSKHKGAIYKAKNCCFCSFFGAVKYFVVYFCIVQFIMAGSAFFLAAKVIVDCDDDQACRDNATTKELFSNALCINMYSQVS